MLKPATTPTPDDLRKNMLSTYFFLRTGIVALAGALPLALLAYSLIAGQKLQHSISAFYGGDMRNWFVGTLCAIGAFLILYKGFSFAEDMALNIAGLFAVLTALKPCDCWEPGAISSRLHLTFASLFFAAMAFVCFRCTTTTISLLPDEPTRARFGRRYFQIGVALVVSPLAAIVVGRAASVPESTTFFVEWFGVWVFAVYWFTKTLEFKISSAERKALRGELQYVHGVGLQHTAPKA